MRIGLRLLLIFFLVLGLSLWVVLRVFVQEVKPGTRLAMEDSLVDTAHAMAALAAPDMREGRMASGGFAQAIEAYASSRIKADIWGFVKTEPGLHVIVTDDQGVVVFDSEGKAVGQDHSRWNDIYLTLRGQYGARSSLVDEKDPGSTAMHVAAPILDGKRLVGVLSVSRQNRTLDPYVTRSEERILYWSWIVLGVTLALGVIMTWWLASSMSRLTGYALAVARGERAQLPRMGRLSGRTEFTDLAEAVEHMRLKLEDKDYVERYVHTLTHELKSPLAAVKGAAELLQEDLPEADRQRFVGNIQRQTERLHQLIERLLALADVEHMRALDAVEPVDLAALSREVVQSLEPRWHSRQLDVSLQVDSSLNTVVQGSGFLLRQALHNLLDNAIDFSPEAGRIDISLSGDGPEHIIWRVRDHGQGVPDYAADRVFERFYSLPRAEGQDRSSGLGLSMVREVAELHHAQADVGNHPEGGCIATMRLPRQQPQAPQQRAKPADRQSPVGG
ncbi:two-component system sensor histidine kinase CreC [Hydrogenophaga sp. 5NK40-0174]|uniref:two-component system sensor histidine kinase CreC n=1 Tax=Hydrogenophaga sp. 5NK40-0174 TaxID=3127649 RepID=UPI0031045E27